MRILAIRGENLASLADRFEIDFEAAPLRSAGLFTITGETGAGKSTLLDALCLALYDEFPRVAAQGAKEAIPDPSGKTIAANDPRTILRRGAGRGFAEADFVARDGRRYRARCELSRARGRAAGALQTRARALYRLEEDGTFAPIESGVELVNQKIVELTDLTFDQFGRMVLLAQGDFDAFLRATPDQRAVLLEKITGAQIYADISRRAFSRAKDAGAAVAALEQRRAEIGLTPDETRAALVDERAQGEVRREELVFEREAVLELLRRQAAIRQAEGKLAQAIADKDAASINAEVLSDAREKLAAIARAEPLRAVLVETQRMEAALAGAIDAETRAIVQESDALTALEQVRARDGRAAAALIALEDEWTRIEPIWSQAAILDSRVVEFAKEETTTSAAAAKAREAARVKGEEQERATQSFEDTRLKAISARVERDAAIFAKPLHERWSEIEEWLDKRAELTTARIDASRRLESVARDIFEGEARLAAFDATDETDRANIQSLAIRLSDREAALAALDENAAQRRADELAALVEAIQDLTRLTRAYGDANTRRGQALAEIEAADRGLARFSQELAILRNSRAEQAARRDEAEKLGEIADATTSEAALRLRAALIDNEACPVCGGRDHPYARSSEAANELVSRLRARREKLRRELATTDEAIVARCEDQARATASRDDAIRRREATALERDQAARDYANFVENWPTEDEAFAPPTKIDGATERLGELGAASDSARQGNVSARDAARILREEIDSLRKAQDGTRGALDARAAERRHIAATIEQARHENIRLKATIENARERVASLARSLEPFLLTCDLCDADLDRDPAGARRRLRERGVRCRDAETRLSALDAELAKLIPRNARLNAETDAVQRLAETAGAAHEALAKALAEARTERAQMLGGEATQDHRARFDERRRVAVASRDSAREECAKAVERMAAGAERRALASSALTRAEDEARRAKNVFVQAIALAGFDETTVAALLAVSPDEQTDMRAGLEAADAALAAAASAVLERQRDLDEALVPGRPEEASEALAARRDRMSEAIDLLARRLGEISALLAQDDAARQRAGALTKEIEEARKAHKSWEEINVAIGSASGDKFRRFAQGVTLERLVALANQRLAALAPRYALERAAGEGADLGLQIIDREFCDERRSTRSLSGGERFLASLALALALAGLEGRESFVDTLFIDEGFGALDAATLDVAIDALETLQAQGRKVGVISHVDALHQRIATQIRVEKRGGGKSVVRVAMEV